jgi:hypothetical protein
VDESAFGTFGLGGPAAPEDWRSEGVVDARAVAPTLADLLDVADSVPIPFERSSVL